MLKMVIIDESGKAASTLERLFTDEYTTSILPPEALSDQLEKDIVSPQLVLFVSKGDIPLTKQRIERIRTMWPKAAVLLLLPGVHDEKQLGPISIPAHKMLFKPCTKKRVAEVVTNYRSLMTDENTLNRSTALLSTLVEFTGERSPNLYIAYNRVRSQITTMCNALGGDRRQIQETFMLYIILLSHMDDDLLDAMTRDDDKDAEVLNKVHVHLQKMVYLLELSPAAQDLARDLKYVLKHYDGSGFPKDDVSGLELPISSRIINLLMDYHLLLQNGKSAGQALFALHQREGWYDNVLLQAFMDMQNDDDKKLIRDVYPLGLVAGMEIAHNVYGVINGKRRKVLARNEILSEETIDYLQRHSDDILDITEPIQVFDALFNPETDTHV